MDWWHFDLSAACVQPVTGLNHNILCCFALTAVHLQSCLSHETLYPLYFFLAYIPQFIVYLLLLSHFISYYSDLICI